ncbi:3-methylaspartate ammonia-lyase, glutamate mutase [Pseudomonas sp. Ag1]|uniref:acyclic terpene utilization AtuA family protein n=1 Tax=Pseudomonas sp. Ag1 TaxID=1197727 RepID=UPI000272CA10|nr:acyclic terpene utilization AtuA family protein [Pseudomonas sp. Ag1]EJF69777.1 3-methylaspartate ammonia-lyase, glutamate mutase [Pseudomonas sp. Ag1]
MNTPIKVLVPSGSMGSGLPLAAFEQALLELPDVIATDSGSTDSGPHYLGTGKTKSSVMVLKSELRTLMIARAKLGIPLIVGSCGTCGSDDGVNMMRRLSEELAIELGQTVQVACIYSEQLGETVKTALREGRISSLQPQREIDEALIDRCSHIVAVMGIEPFIHALSNGADIIFAGRATDTAVMASLPIMRGAAPGASWHAGKILECGAMCTTTPGKAVVMATIDDQGFTLQAIADGAKATPRSVMAHMLYENSNPYVLVEPGGSLNVEAATYTALDEQSVRVEGSVWTPTDTYTVKLEGAAPAGYQSTIMCIIRNPKYKARFEEWLACMDEAMHYRIRKSLEIEAADYDLQFRAIGKDSALGSLEALTGDPVEIGVLAIVTSPDETRTREILSLLNPYMLHFPLPDDESLPTHAFPFSPASMDRGVVYEFVLNHVMTVTDPLAPFVFEFSTFGVSQ